MHAAVGTADRPMSSGTQFWLAAGMCLGLLVIIATLLVAIWHPDR